MLERLAALQSGRSQADLANLREVPAMIEEIMQAFNTDENGMGSAIERFASRNLASLVQVAEESQRIETELGARGDLDRAERLREQARREQPLAAQFMGEVVSSFRDELRDQMDIPWLKTKKSKTAGKDTDGVRCAFDYPAFTSADANSNPHHQVFDHLFNAKVQKEMPRAIKIHLLANWLSIRDMGRLDSAVTCRALRPAFLSVLKGMHAGAFDTYHYGSLPLLRWVGHKGIDVRNLEVTLCEVKGGDTALIWAIREGEGDIVALLYQCSDINTPTSNSHCKDVPGGCPIHFACNSRNLQIVKLLALAPKLKFDSKDATGRSALHFVLEPTPALLASTDAHACEIVKILLSRCPELAHAVDNTGTTPLMAACKVGNAALVELLLDNGANPCDMKDKKGKTCLFLACSNGHTAVVGVLVSRFGRALALLENQKTSSGGDGKTCLHLACATGHDALVAILLCELNLDFTKDNKGKTPLHIAAEQGFIAIVRLLLEKYPNELDSGDSDRNTVLHLACQSGHLYVASMLIQEFDIPLNTPNRIGYTPLHYAVSKGKFECARMLVEAGAFVNAQGLQGSTPLIIACFKNMVDIAQMLVLEGKAETDVRSNLGTALFLAVDNNKIELVHLLLRAGNSVPDVVCQPDGSTALHLAASKCQTDMVKCLLTEGLANPSIKLLNGQTPLHKVCDAVDSFNPYLHKANPIPEIITSLIEAKCYVDEADKDGKTPLHVAVNNKNLAAARVLCQHGANASFCAFDGSSPLTAAVGSKSDEMVKMLVMEFGAEVNTTDEWGLSPLLTAARKGYREMCKILIKAGADVNAVDSQGMTALALAASCAHQDVIKLLLASGADKNLRDIHGKAPVDYTELVSIRKLLS